MKNIDVVISTRNRYKKLLRCLKTIPKRVENITIKIVIICDGDGDTWIKLKDNEQVDKVILVSKHRGAVYCRNFVIKNVEDYLLYATDDIEFMEGAIEEAVRMMKEKFPDGDGVIGFNQINHKSFSKAGVGLMGQKFLQRYPDKELFYPEYFHFSCQEIERLGDKLNKIILAENARLIHYHPSFIVGEMDETHREARKYRKADRAISMMRRAKGIIWGDKNE